MARDVGGAVVVHVQRAVDIADGEDLVGVLPVVVLGRVHGQFLACHTVGAVRTGEAEAVVGVQPEPLGVGGPVGPQGDQVFVAVVGPVPPVGDQGVVPGRVGGGLGAGHQGSVTGSVVALQRPVLVDGPQVGVAVPVDVAGLVRLGGTEGVEEVVRRVGRVAGLVETVCVEEVGARDCRRDPDAGLAVRACLDRADRLVAVRPVLVGNHVGDPAVGELEDAFLPDRAGSGGPAVRAVRELRGGDAGPGVRAVGVVDEAAAGGALGRVPVRGQFAVPGLGLPGEVAVGGFDVVLEEAGGQGVAGVLAGRSGDGLVDDQLPVRVVVGMMAGGPEVERDADGVGVLVGRLRAQGDRRVADEAEGRGGAADLAVARRGGAGVQPGRHSGAGVVLGGEDRALRLEPLPAEYVGLVARRQFEGDGVPLRCRRVLRPLGDVEGEVAGRAAAAPALGGSDGVQHLAAGGPVVPARR